jgi:hypothetical protein
MRESFKEKTNILGSFQIEPKRECGIIYAGEVINLSLVRLLYKLSCWDSAGQDLCYVFVRSTDVTNLPIF